MLKRCIHAEWLKLRHSNIYLVLIVLPILSIIIGCVNFYFNQNALSNGWYSLWTQVSLFYGEFFLPILIAICCAYISRLEHINKNWNTVMTAPVSATNIFVSKLFVVAILILMVNILFLVLYIFAGNLLGLSNSIPREVIGWLFRGFIASISISAVQLGFSIKIRSFAVPIGISICAVFIGLGMYVVKMGMFFPYSLLTIGMGVLSQESLQNNTNILFYTMNLIFLILASVLSINRLRKADIN